MTDDLNKNVKLFHGDGRIFAYLAWFWLGNRGSKGVVWRTSWTSLAAALRPSLAGVEFILDKKSLRSRRWDENAFRILETRLKSLVKQQLNRVQQQWRKDTD